ncbi:MAG: SPOR domain-containing protein [Candidatus Gastranaerophilaceae bacterium]|jgi:hypothetical protein
MNQNQNQKRMEMIKKRKKRLVWVFTITFVVIFVFFSWLASVLTPKLHNPILDGQEDDLEVNSSEFKGRVDSRLKFIELQDSTPQQSTQQATTSEAQGEQPQQQQGENLYPNQPDDVVNQQESAFQRPNKFQQVDKSQEDTVDYNNDTNYSDGTDQNSYQEPTSAVNKPPAPPVPIRHKISKEQTVKVLVGSYSTKADAEVAAQKLGSTVLGEAPFIKRVDGKYTLQAGSFHDANSAMSTVQRLQSNNLNVKLIKE